MAHSYHHHHEKIDPDDSDVAARHKIVRHIPPEPVRQRRDDSGVSHGPGVQRGRRLARCGAHRGQPLERAGPPPEEVREAAGDTDQEADDRQDHDQNDAVLIRRALRRDLEAPRVVAVLPGPVAELRLEGLATPPALCRVRDRVACVVLEPGAAFERGLVVHALDAVPADLGVARLRLPDLHVLLGKRMAIPH